MALKSKDRSELLELLPTGATGAEIGVWRGQFSQQLLAQTLPKTLYLIDAWQFQADDAHQFALYGRRQISGQPAMDLIYRGVRRLFKREIAQGTLEILRSDSVKALDSLQPSSLDWIYVDGDHRYEAVLGNLRAALRVVRPGGLIVCDDHVVAGWWQDGVVRAVAEFESRPPDVDRRRPRDCSVVAAASFT